MSVTARLTVTVEIPALPPICPLCLRGPYGTIQSYATHASGHIDIPVRWRVDLMTYFRRQIGWPPSVPTTSRTGRFHASTVCLECSSKFSSPAELQRHRNDFHAIARPTAEQYRAADRQHKRDKKNGLIGDLSQRSIGEIDPDLLPRAPRKAQLTARVNLQLHPDTERSRVAREA